MKSVEKWRSLVENVPDIIIVADRDGTIQFINHTVSVMTPEEVIGKKLYDYILAEHHEIMRNYLEQVFQTGVGGDYELIGAGPDGTTSWYGSCIGPIKLQGQIVAASIVTRDITGRKKAEEEIKRLSSAVEQSIDGIAIGDLEPRIIYVNRAYAEMHGYSPEEMIGMKVDNIHNKEQMDEYKRAIEQIKTKGSWIGEVSHIKKDGTAFPTYMSTTLLKDDKGEPNAILVVARDITEQKKVEEALKESEQRFRNIFDNAADGIVLADVENGKFHISNKTFSQMLGYNAEEIKNLGVSDIHPKESLSYVIDNFERQTRKEFTLARDIPVERKDGSIFYADINTHLIKLAGKKYLMGIFRDVTERKQAEQALRESQRWQIAILNSIPDMAWLKDKQSRYVAANETLCRAFGIKLEDFIGKTDFDISPEDLAKRYQADDRKVIKTGERLRTEEPWATKEDTGERICIETIKTPIRNEKGEIIGTSGIARNITERKKAEEALRQSEMKYRTLLESLPQKVFLKDKYSVYISCNENYARDMRIKAGEITGKTDYDFYPGELAEKYRADDKNIIESGETKDIDEIYIRDDKETIVHTVKTPVKDEQGNVVGILGVFWDITKIKQTEEELDMYREQMTRAERLASIGTLSATVAHELNQPLTVINLAIENSLAELKKMSCPDSVMEDLKRGLSEVSNANSIVNRFRNFARESPEKSVRKVDLKVVAERITDLLEENARRAKVTLQVKGMGKLPPIYSNEKDMEQLFFALIDNAIQSADGKKNHRLIISGHLRDDRYIDLRFSDNCGGIAPENINRIFEPFFTTRPQGKGTGLGLCIVQRIALRTGGKVRVESKTGEGSTFLITLPINPH